MGKEDKNTIIKQIVAAAREHGHFYLIDTTAMNAAVTSELRGAYLKADTKPMITKNTPLHKALESIEGNLPPLYGSSKGTAVMIFCSAANAPAKLVKDKSRDGIPGSKAAYVEESFHAGADQLDALVVIKGKNEVIADIVALLQSPTRDAIPVLQSGGNTLHRAPKTPGGK